MAVREWPDLDNLARETKRRRDQLNLRQEDLASHGGPSHVTVRDIETQARDGYRQDTYVKLDKALRLRPGSARRALDGYAFEVLEDEEAAALERPRTSRIDVRGLSDGQIAELLRDVERKVERMRRKTEREAEGNGSA